MGLQPANVRSGLRRAAGFAGQFTFSIVTAICAGVVTSMVLPYLSTLPSAQYAKSSAHVPMWPSYRMPSGVAVPLSSAFTIDGFDGAATENMFSEYMLRVARPDAGSDIRIADWTTPDKQPPARLARAEWSAPVKRGVELQRPLVLAPLPPRRVVAPAQHAAPAEPAPIQISMLTDAAAQPAPAKSFAAIQNWLPELSVPNVLPMKAKVVGTLSSVGDTLGGWIPHL